MEIVLNHITRMAYPRICIAGIDRETGAHIRPVTPSDDLITRELLRSEGGYLAPGAVLEIGRTIPRPNRPEVEDQLTNTASISPVGQLGAVDYLKLLSEMAVEDAVSALGPDLLEIRDERFAVPKGNGDRSLGIISSKEVRLSRSFGNAYLHIPAGDGEARVRVSDVRFYKDDHETVRDDVFTDVSRRINSGVRGYVMLGLARAMPDRDGQDLHWPMCNGICLEDNPTGDLP